MCNNLIVLYVFIIIKIIAVIVLPILIYIFRKKEFVKYMLAIDIVILLFFLICNAFTINKCVYNSNPEGLKRTKNENKIVSYNTLHPPKINSVSNAIVPNKDYKTYLGKDLYYYNQNSETLRNLSYTCGDDTIYFNSFGNGITTIATVYSTLYNRNIDPIGIYNYLVPKMNFCDREATIEEIHRNLTYKHTNIELKEISVNQVEKSIKSGNIVIAKLNAKEDSKLTCDSTYIIIYNIDTNGKFMITDSSLLDKTYICPYSSDAYGNIISSDNMKNSWSLSEIDNETVTYYQVRKV